MTEIFKRYKYVYDSRKHLLEMLEDRGFDIEHLKNYTVEDIKSYSWKIYNIARYWSIRYIY